jgi:6-pyruvoyltetrahydropterin/6-carboxytetrahydropterin synthase
VGVQDIYFGQNTPTRREPPAPPRRGGVPAPAHLEAAWRPIHAALDHRNLNDIAGLDNPTSENLAVWLWQQLKPALPGLSQIKVMETHDSGCVYRGPF